MKKVPDYRPKAEREKDNEPQTLVFKPCCNCGKQITAGYYGRFGDGGVCSKKCNTAFEASKPSMIDYQLEKHHEADSDSVASGVDESAS